MLRVRGPAYSVMTECLRLQADARPQSRLARLFGANPLTPGARSWYRDALVEMRDAKQLKNLGAGFTLLHAAPVGEHGDADHLVIGPTGVFTIATKNHSGYRIAVADDVLTVNTRRTHHIRDARFEAARLSRILTPKASEPTGVIPLISIVDPRSLVFGKTRPTDVLVVASSQLARTIVRRPTVLSDAEIVELVGLAELDGAWHADSRVFDDTLRHEARFARLTQLVDAAARRKAMWIAGGVLAGLAVIAAWSLLG